jgi:two-component system phosphate regulon sensor histidine kinase PhoR
MIKRNPWPHFFRALAIYYLVWLFIGFSSEHLLISLLIGTTALTAFVLYNMWRIESWLRSRKLPPPDLYGIWDEMAYLISAWRQRDRNRSMKLSQLIRRFEASALALPDAIIGLNAFSEIDWWNESASTMFNLRWPDDKGQRIDNLIRNPLFIQFFRGETDLPFIHITSPAAEESEVEIRLVRYGDLQTLLIARDISEASKLHQMRKDFVANVSHELRTPLTVLHGTAEMFIDALEDFPEEWRSSIELMAKQTERMRNLVDDLLTLSKLETAAQVDRSTVLDIPQILEHLKETASVFSGEKHHKISLEYDPNLLLHGSEKELTSAFTNLVYNAINYTPAEKEIWIRWYQSATGPCFEVQDQGMGIEAKHLPRLTERFYRIDPGRSRDSGGTGLGLAIVKRVLLRHQAALEIESELHQGSLFRCRFKPDWSGKRRKRAAPTDTAPGEQV